MPALIAVMGPTASGKTFVAECVADRLGAMLVNADAFQAYMGLDVGTAKPTNRERYSLLDYLRPDEPQGLGRWLREALSVLDAAVAEDRPVVVVGGSGLYVRALFEEYEEIYPPPDESLRQRLDELDLSQLVELLGEYVPSDLDTANPVRVRREIERRQSPGEPMKVKLPPFEKFKFGLVPDKAEHKKALESRLEAMFEAGWIDEVQALKCAGYTKNSPAMRAIGYESIFDYLEGELTEEGLREAVRRDTQSYAKRQLTWLRTEPRLRLIEMRRLDERSLAEACDAICEAVTKGEGFDG